MSDKPVFRIGDGKGYVYIMRPIGHNVYKIGYTLNLEHRLQVYQNKFCFELEYVHFQIVDDPENVEERLHQIFNPNHLAGDWFVFSDEELSIVMEKMK